MSSSLWTVVLMAFLLLGSEMASASQVFRQNNGNNRVFIFQIPLQQLDPKISPRTPDSTTTEDSYIVALRESQISRNKVPVTSFGQRHHHHDKGHHHVESHHHHFVEDANKQFKGQQHHSTNVPPTYGQVLTTRPLTAMEKNYLRPHRPQLYQKSTLPDSHNGELHQSEEVVDEETSEEVMETSASDKVATLSTRPFSSVSDVNSMYSTYSSNPARFVNKPPSIRKSFEITETATIQASDGGSKKPQENNRKPIKKTLQIRVPEMVGVMTNRAANVVRNGMKTVGSTIGIPVRNSLVGKVNYLLPVVAALSVGRKKRSIAEEFQEAKGWKDNIHKSSTRTLGYMEFLTKLMNKPWQSATANTNKFSNAGKRPLWLQFTRSTSRPVDSIRNGVTNKAHSVVKRSMNLNTKNKFFEFRATAFKRVIPWLHSAFSRNKNKRKESKVTDADITDEGNFMEENEVNVDRLMYSPSPQTKEENQTSSEQNVDVNVLLLGDKDKKKSALTSELKGDELETVDKYAHGHGIIVLPPEEVPDIDETNKDTYGHEAAIPSENENDSYNDEDESKYTHGHGIIVPNPSEDSDGLTEESSGETANIDTNIENNNLTSVASPDDPYIATGVFGDEVDSELDDLGSLMADIIIAPLPVEAVVAEESVTEPSPDPFDAVIIESAEVENKPNSPVIVSTAGPTIDLPVPSNLANIFITASSTSDNSQTSSSSSSSSGSISSGGITGSTISAASVDPFASLYTFGLAAIGIFVLSLPIWVPIVATKMKRRRNKLTRNRSQPDFPTLSLYTDMEFNPYSILMRNLMPYNSEEPFSDPGPLKSEEVYGPAASNFADRR